MPKLNSFRLFYREQSCYRERILEYYWMDLKIIIHSFFKKYFSFHILFYRVKKCTIKNLYAHWEKRIFESKNISLVQINGWAGWWKIHIFLDQRNIFIVFKKWIIKAKKCFSSTIKYLLHDINMLITLCCNYLIREVNSLM